VVLLSGDGSTLLLLPAAPVSDVSVKVDGAEVTDFSVSAKAGVLRRGAGWPDGLDNIEVTYSHGHSTIPGGIQDAVLEQAAILAKVPAGVQSESAGGQSVTWGLQATTGVTQKWSEAVAAYRLGGLP
jgi:hypothetical protein